MEYESYNNWFSAVDEQKQESRPAGTPLAVTPPSSFSPFKLFDHQPSPSFGTPACVTSSCVTPSSVTSTSFSPSSATSNAHFDLPTPASQINWSDILCTDCKCKVSKVMGGPNNFAPMKRKLNYDVNFGSFGIEIGQFSEPAGICVTVDGFIAITDTKTHRIQVFDKIGCLKLSFGTPGTNPGQILYPNCIASCPATRNYVITERTPVHQVQVYSSTGQFVRRFGQNFIQFPRGVCVDKGGNIIVVECKVMRVTIFDQLGTVIRTFCVPNVMSFPMGVCSNEKYEIFVVDNRKHCIHVFDYNGRVLRTMCSNGSISFPISININAANELVVTDNHQSFNMTFFTQAGELIRGYESRNRHPQCLAAAVLGVDKIFLATKDYRIYGYDCSKGK